MASVLLSMFALVMVMQAYIFFYNLSRVLVINGFTKLFMILAFYDLIKMDCCAFYCLVVQMVDHF